MEEVVCAERGGFPFGPGAWPEFWTLLFLSLARPLAVRGVRESEVGSGHRAPSRVLCCLASSAASRPARVLVSFIVSNERVWRDACVVERLERTVCAGDVLA